MPFVAAPSVHYVCCETTSQRSTRESQPAWRTAETTEVTQNAVVTVLFRQALSRTLLEISSFLPVAHHPTHLIQWLLKERFDRYRVPVVSEPNTKARVFSLLIVFAGCRLLLAHRLGSAKPTRMLLMLLLQNQWQRQTAQCRTKNLRPKPKASTSVRRKTM